MKLGRGAIVPSTTVLGEPVDVVVNGRIIARGEVVVEDDNSLRHLLTETGAPAGTRPQPGLKRTAPLANLKPARASW
jgi:flagellar motor switch protein FliN/FliY